MGDGKLLLDAFLLRFYVSFVPGSVDRVRPPCRMECPLAGGIKLASLDIEPTDLSPGRLETSAGSVSTTGG